MFPPEIRIGVDGNLLQQHPFLHSRRLPRILHKSLIGTRGMPINTRKHQPIDNA